MYQHQSDLLATILLLIYVLLGILITEYLARSGKVTKLDARKFLHISMGNLVFFLPLFESYALVVAIPAVFIVGNYLMSPYSPVKSLKMNTFEAGHGFGTIYYAISLTILAALSFARPDFIFLAFLPLAYGDGFAAYIGVRATKYRFRAIGGEKSLNGTIALFVASFFSSYLGTLVFGSSLLLISLIIAVCATILELISPKGTDNLVMPLGLYSILLLLQNIHML